MDHHRDSTKSILNTTCVLMCGFSKFPQISTNLRAKSTESLSLAGLFVDAFSYTISVRYFVYHGYAWMDFLEYPMIMVQIAFLVSLRLVYEFKARDLLVALCTYALLAFAISDRSISFPGPILLRLLLNLSTPISIFGKVLYIRAIVKSNRGDLTAKLPWFLNGTASFIRIFTVMMEGGDLNILAGLFFSVALNYLTMVVAIMYTPIKGEAEEVKKKFN